LESPTEVGVRYVAYFLISLLLVIPISLALSIILLSPLPFLLLLFPFIFIFYPEQKYKSRAREVRDSIQDEIPFFVTLITIINASGTTIYEGMRKIVQFPLFKAIEKGRH